MIRLVPASWQRDLSWTVPAPVSDVSESEYFPSAGQLALSILIPEEIPTGSFASIQSNGEIIGFWRRPVDVDSDQKPHYVYGFSAKLSGVLESVHKLHERRLILYSAFVESTEFQQDENSFKTMLRVVVHLVLRMFALPELRGEDRRLFSFLVGHFHSPPDSCSEAEHCERLRLLAAEENFAAMTGAAAVSAASWAATSIRTLATPPSEAASAWA
eukprot:CAMPEP_0172151310 /NCGR_PEP_ID=MMETSP1050-20130122/156_1 /TAXON_ID=233186 /ORGANISM="Cryptomonas curvata, Strain CCAP979/52" /LENGTH=214 /DNA_ID=CAMNT_0012819397 /DNA_START=86 /DNA_END=728 /DNA_ORIENTATION=+